MLGENSLLSVGIDIGTTTTHLVVSRLYFGNLSRPTQVSEIGLTDKEVLYKSAIYETPVQNDGAIDADAIAVIIKSIYKDVGTKTGIDMSAVDTGAVIITGESAAARNAARVLERIAAFAGDFISESAGPGLESILCARGCGAQIIAREQNCTVLNLDIGGGTSNFALVEQGQITATAAVSIGGRAIKFQSDKISKISDTAKSICAAAGIDLKVADKRQQSISKLHNLADLMAQILIDLCCGYKTERSSFQSLKCADLWLTEPLYLDQPAEKLIFSGGVAALMDGFEEDKEKHRPETTFDDFGPYLAGALIKNLNLAGLPYLVASDAIRATVLGAGMHTLQLSGSTIGAQGDNLPLKNIPLLKIALAPGQDLIVDIKNGLRQKGLDWQKKIVVLALSGLSRDQLQYRKIKELATSLAAAHSHLKAIEPLVVVVDQDIAMALGQLLKRLMPDKRIISVDGIRVLDGDYLDIGKPLHSKSLSDNCTQTLPVVVKTLIFYKN